MTLMFAPIPGSGTLAVVATSDTRIYSTSKGADAIGTVNADDALCQSGSSPPGRRGTPCKPALHLPAASVALPLVRDPTPRGPKSQLLYNIEAVDAIRAESCRQVRRFA